MASQLQPQVQGFTPDAKRLRLRLLVQPGDGLDALTKAINKAKESVELLIFRFDRRELERALGDAAKRGLFVHALIAYTNRGGEKSLRKLEARLLAAGVSVARSANDLTRYHAKYVIIDRRLLFVLAFNFTYMDIQYSRSFGLVTANRKFVQEATRLFEADVKRQPYETSVKGFVVSPVNARPELAAFIRGAKKELLIYDPEISDRAMIRLLKDRVRAGVSIRVIGHLSGNGGSGIEVKRLAGMRLHCRTILRDGQMAFVGSQSLREAELDSRRELGMIFRDRNALARMIKTFQEDWETSERDAGELRQTSSPPVEKVARQVAKAVTKDLPPITAVLEDVMQGAAGNGTGLNRNDTEQTIRGAVREAVADIVRDVLENAVEEQNATGGK